MQRIVVPLILQPNKVAGVIRPKSLLIQNKVAKEEPKKLLVAAGAGGIPPTGNGNDNIPSPFKKPLSAEFVKKINEMTRGTNNIKNKIFDIFKNNLK